jgi:hypothetical protein
LVLTDFYSRHIAIPDPLAETAMKRLLAQSEKFKIVSEYEYVHLVFNTHNILRGDKTVYIGDFYGDPTCALISKDERYLVVGGNGIIIYLIQKPFALYDRSSISTQFKELFRDPENTLWIDALYQSELDQDWKYFRAVIDTDDDVSVYKINAETGEHIKLQKSG